MRQIKLSVVGDALPCPKCGNQLEFTAHSQQVCEVGCEAWIVCQCGFDPTAENTLFRYENIMGGTGDDTVAMAIECWNDAVSCG